MIQQWCLHSVAMQDHTSTVEHYSDDCHITITLAFLTAGLARVLWPHSNVRPRTAKSQLLMTNPLQDATNLLRVDIVYRDLALLSIGAP